jgi:hypothetical protein
LRAHLREVPHGERTLQIVDRVGRLPGGADWRAVVTAARWKAGCGRQDRD